MKMNNLFLIGLVVVLVGCSTVSKEKNERVQKEREQNEIKLKQAATEILLGRKLWLKPPKLNDCDYDVEKFPVFSQVEIASGKFDSVSAPFYKLIVQLRGKNKEG